MTLRRYRPIAVLLVVVHTTACSTWQPTTASPRQVIEDTRPGRVRVTKADGTTVVAHEPGIRGDSITSVEKCRGITTATGQARCVRTTEPVAVAFLDEALTVEVFKLSEGRTLLLVMPFAWLLVGLLNGPFPNR